MVVEKQQERHTNDKKRRFRRPFQRSPTNGTQKNGINKERDKLHNNSISNVTTISGSSSNFQDNSTSVIVNNCSKDSIGNNFESNNANNMVNNHDTRSNNNKQHNNRNYSNNNNNNNTVIKDQQSINPDNLDQGQFSNGTCLTVDDNEQVKLSTNRNRVEKKQQNQQLNSQLQSTKNSSSKLQINSQPRQQIHSQHNHINNKSNINNINNNHNNHHHNNNHHHHYNNHHHYNAHDRYNHDRRGRGYNYSSSNRSNYRQTSYDTRKMVNGSNGGQNFQTKLQHRSQQNQSSAFLQDNVERHCTVKEIDNNNVDNLSNTCSNNNLGNNINNFQPQNNQKRDFQNNSRRESNLHNSGNKQHTYRDNSNYHSQKDSCNKLQSVSSQKDQGDIQIREKVNKIQVNKQSTKIDELGPKVIENNFEQKQRNNNSESNVEYKLKSKHESNNIGNSRNSSQNFYNNHGNHINTTNSWKGSNNVNHTYSRQNRYNNKTHKHSNNTNLNKQSNVNNEIGAVEGTVKPVSRSSNNVSNVNNVSSVSVDDLKKKRNKRRYNKNNRGGNNHHQNNRNNNGNLNLSKDKPKFGNDIRTGENLSCENESKKISTRLSHNLHEDTVKTEKISDSKRGRSHSTGIEGISPSVKDEETELSSNEIGKVQILDKKVGISGESNIIKQCESNSANISKDFDESKSKDEVESGRTTEGVSKESDKKKDSGNLTSTIGPWRRPNHGNQAVDSLETVRRTVKSLLNKITVEKFTVIAEKLAVCIDEIKDVDELEELVKQVLDKAITEPDFSEMYADLCQILKWRSPVLLKKDNETTTGFSRALLIRCEQEFKNLPRSMTPTDEERKLYDSEELAILYRKRKLHVLGIIRLIGELFIRKMFPMRSLNELVFDLVMIQENPDEYAIECLCQLIITTGYYLDSNEKSQMIVDQWFGRLKELQKSHISTRLNCLIQDVFDLRKHKWVKKVHKQKAKALADILKDIDVEDVLGGAAIAAQYGSVVVVGERSNLVGNSAYYNYMTSQEELYLSKQKNSQK